MESIKNMLKLNTTFSKIEFWAAITIFAFVLFFFLVDGYNNANAGYKISFDEAGVSFKFYRNFFIPQLIRHFTLFLGVLYLNFVLVPNLISKKKLLLTSILVVGVFLFIAFIFGTTDHYLREYFYRTSEVKPIQVMFSKGIASAIVIFSVFSIYSLIKYISLYLLAVSEKIELKYRFIRREAIVATFIWLIILLFLVIENAPGIGIAGWVTAVPSAILLYLAGFYILIPSSLNKKYPFIIYAVKNAAILFIVLLAWGIILKLIVGGVIRGDKAPLAALWIFNSILQMFITVPVTWLLYKRQMKGNEQLNVLKKELGQSTASLDFLRSQINPHFLFNALNTIYGTAIQEKAERTSEGIEKLGDMMRFMLQENMQEKISLSREVRYLNNYISLQKLRTGQSPNIRIDTQIEEQLHSIQIAPMLLIPFVENAFKHGISFRESSYIKIKLEIYTNTLLFEVSNSKHPRHENDPEKNISGIGLENVKQRLNLLYPNKHQLNIQDSQTDFFVHLTIHLV